MMVVVNEVIDLTKKIMNSCLIFKVDFEKTYDSVSWEFMKYMLVKFG